MREQAAEKSKKLVIGNWKCTKSFADACRWFDSFSADYEPSEEVEVVIAPPMIMLAQLADYLFKKGVQVSLAAQDVSPFPPGSYTGATAGDMLKGISDYAIVGHHERRRYFHETSQDVTNKVSETADAGIKPIVCVDTDHAMSQLTSLGDIDCDNLVIAYCPVDALSYREPQAPEKIAEAASFISQVYPARPIIYGGAISEKNVEQFLSISRISGLFIGSASLHPDSFGRIVRAVQR